MHKGHVFVIIFVVLVATGFSTNGRAYWPIVFQLAKKGSDFSYLNGPVQVKDGEITVYTNQSSAESLVSYKFVLNEFASFNKETFGIMEVFLQIYPADVRGYVYGKSGEVHFNGVIIKVFNLTFSYPESSLFFDRSNYRFTQGKLNFSTPLYSHLSSRSEYVQVPVSLLDKNINVTFRMDSTVIWEVHIISLIVHLNPEKTDPWWRENLPLIFGILFVEAAGATVLAVKFIKPIYRKRLRQPLYGNASRKGSS